MKTESHERHDSINSNLTEQVREAFPEDFHLIEPHLSALIGRYSLREIIIIARLEIDAIKRGMRTEHGRNTPPTIPPLA